jgi:hypothetical protein
MRSWWQLSGALLAAVGFAALFVSPIPAAAQGNQGQNAICNSNQPCAISTLTGSSAFIDASVYGSPNTNFCAVIHTILTNPHLTPPFVIDARGLPGTTGTSMDCSSSPWAGITNPPGSVILLPAGTITTSASWVLPANTKLVGTAKGNGSLGNNNYVFETMIQASANFSGAVVQFGDSTHCPSGCQGISVEHLTINGNGSAGYTMNGIENDYCGQQCYVEHVTLYQVLGTGLKLSGSYATDSGPYSNITFDLAGVTPQISSFRRLWRLCLVPWFGLAATLPSRVRHAAPGSRA